jgi:hypothetical protein
MQYGRDCQNTVGVSRQTCALRGGFAEDSNLHTVKFGVWLPNNHTSFIYSVHKYEEIKETKLWKLRVCPSVTMLDTPA